MEDDVSGDAMFIIESSGGGSTPPPSFWVANDAGLGVLSPIVTNTGDRIIWSN